MATEGEGEADTLKLYWDHFFKSETGTYEKTTWLDLFLAEFLIRLNEGANANELINFCPVSGVVTLVGCELLCGIHRVTSSINTHYAIPLPGVDAPPCSGHEAAPLTRVTTGIEGSEAEPKTEDTRPAGLFTRANAQSSAEILKKYLLSGVAWKCLVLLKALGVEGLSCCRQLSSVLIWLYGELGGGGSGSGNQQLYHHPPETPMYQLFSHKIWAKQKLNNTQGAKLTSAPSEKGSITRRSRLSSQIKLESESKNRGKPIKADHSSDSCDSNDDLQVLNRSLTIKLSTPSDDFDYFDSPFADRTPNDFINETLYNDPFYTPRKTKPKAEDYTNDSHREIINSEISSFEFTLIITDLLQELCKAESSLSGSEGSQISVQCINFSLRNLCSLQFGSLPACSQQYNDYEVSRIKVALTELLLVSLDKVLISSELCAKLINNGILPMLLRILEDVICKCSSRYHAKAEDYNPVNENKVPNKEEAENVLKFVFGIAYSITAFFHCLLMQCRSVDKLREFTDQFKLYGECLKGGLLMECIELMIRLPGVDQKEAIILIKKLIEAIGKLINGMKRVRSEVVHSAACPRSRHKVCRQRVSAGMHHHHDILGEASTGLPLSSTCCVSVLYGTLTSLVAKEEICAHTMLRNKILRVMLNCGVCCCFSPGFLMESIVRVMLTHNTAASLCLQVLEHTVYGELGASVLISKVTDQLPCSVCEPCDDKRMLGKRYCAHGVGPIERKSVWSFLIHYNSLLQLDNHNNVLHATISHLLRVTPKCKMEMKYELLFSVIYPTFIVSKHRYIIRLEESAYFLTVSCLNIFASLLNTVSFAEQFIQKGGLSYVLELVSLSEFSKQCCSILEIAIIVEIFKLMKDNSEMTYFREISSLASVQMLLKSLSEMTEKCFNIYKLKLPEEKFSEFCDISKEREMLNLIFYRRGSEPMPMRKMPQAKTIKTMFATSENVTEESIEDYLEVLKNIWTFWKSCASLCLYSPMFREYIVSESVFLDSYALLKVLLYYLCNCECGMAEMRQLIKIVEALLTVQFAVSDVTSGRSKETSGTLVRGALVAPGPVEAGGALRSLCEALIRVATAAPSRQHTMPRLGHAKIPPLLCPSGSSSVEGSSSEESASGPYASEHSEPHTDQPDEGYEADVEVGQLEQLSSHKSRKLTASLTNLNMSGRQRPAAAAGGSGAECGEYCGGGELAHPDLCLIVVDILTHLVHRLLSCQSEVRVGSMQRSGAALARACCARLATALTRARAAPPLLLQRLLSPTTTSLLTHDNDQLADLQRSILELIHVLASQSIEPSELTAFLQLFKAERPPLAMLLTALQRLAAAATHNTPDCILTFPVDSDRTDNVQAIAEELSHIVLNSATSQSQQAENTARKLHDLHLQAGVMSPWSAGAVRVGIEGAGWAPWLQGFAARVWLRTAPSAPVPVHTPPRPLSPGERDDWETVDDWQEGSCESSPRNKSPARRAPAAAEPLHVLSMGHESLVFEAWLDTDTGTFTFRLSRPETSCNKVLSETRVESGMTPHQWTCVAFNVKEVIHKRRTHIQVTLFVNGCECDTVSLPLQGILVRKVTPTNVLIGHACRHPARGGYHVSHVHVYRAPVLTAYSALHVTAHGPDNACQVRCESPNFPLLLTPNVLDCNIDWDQVYEMSSATLRELNDSLLLTFSAHAHTIMNLYHQTASVTLPTVFAGRVASSGLMSSTAGVQSAGSAPHSSIPETLFSTWSGCPVLSRHRGLTPAIYLLGGPDVLLYLFARVVELGGSGVEQALALSILLRVCRADNRLHAMFYGDGQLDMLHTVLAAPRCRLDVHLLKVLLDEACSSPVLSVSGSTVQVLTRTDAVLLEPRLLVFIMRAWRQLETPQEVSWEMEGPGGARHTSRGTLWALSLCAIRALIRDDHPRRAFNYYQMNRLDLLQHLLLSCKERFLNSECGVLDGGASGSLVELVRGLMGAPPLLCHIALLCDLLLLMHQASDTFVTHSRANFYFLLTTETQDMSEYNINFMTKRKTPKRYKRRSETDLQKRTKSTSAEDTVDENSSNLSKEMQSENNPDSGVESTKEMKGVINTQIRENRKHNISSTSENSDLTAEDSGSGAGAGEGYGLRAEEDALTGYIVVDVDDVNHTTVEMYTSGLYQQRRVRAGAAPGWAACEGLLLLLRDTVGVLPDHAMHQAVCGAIQAESLVVLGNHRDASVRAALVRIVAALQRRATPELARRLKQQYYYLHLANQISLYPGAWELAAACAALLTKCDVPLEDQLDDDIWVDLTEDSIHRSPPLLALLPSCLHDVPLAHNITLIVRRIIDKASLKLLNEVSVAEVTVRSIRAVGSLDDARFEGRELLLNDLHELLNRIAIKALSTQHNMQTISEIHYLLSYVETSSEDGSLVRRLSRDAQVSLYSAQLDYLEERLHSSYTAHTNYANYFTTVLSSAVSIGTEGVSRAELASRHLATVSRAVGFLVAQSPRLPLHSEVGLVDRLLATLLLAVSGTTGQRPKWWVSGSGADWLPPLQELFWWAASPAPGARTLQPRLLRTLYLAPPAAVHSLTPPDPPAMRKLAVYLLQILKNIHAEAEQGGATTELAITDWAREWAVSTQAGLAERLHSEALADEAAGLLRADEARWARTVASHRHRAAMAKTVFSKDTLANKLTETAMGITRQVVDVQNGERKAFMEHLRRAQSEAVASAQRWQRLIDTYTHEQALWHDPTSYPQWWLLDPTEAPGRMRVRLRRANLNIPEKFLKPGFKHKAESGRRPSPLRSVVGGNRALRGGLVARLQLHETVAHMARVTYVTVAADTPGELLLSDRCIHFVPEESDSDDHCRKSDRFPCEHSAVSWQLDAVTCVATRRWCLQERAVELFLSSGHAHLLAFADLNERTAFLKALNNCHLPNRTEPESLTDAMNQWRNGTITNWEYIMKLNGLGGRSYNDLMQYPVLPFVLADYTSRILDLNDPASFRDLSKPMAIQNKNREQHYINTYNDLKVARREGCSPLLSRQPHHYASLYSNSGGVLHYLVRLPPFTELFLNYQDNNFDMPDRTFHSLATTWRLITNDSPTDVKELIPELFYLPELFCNNEGLELGVRQCGAGIDDVELPPWAADARLFTLLHRQALEARAVTERLPHWLDLVFGYKQTGQPAVDAINVFPACTYYGFDPCALEDEVDRTAAAAMVRTYGQAPRQLLRHAHPHAPTELAHQPNEQMSIWAGVVGARWGRYCGSPALGAPAVAARRQIPGACALHALPHPRAVAATSKATALLALSAEGPAPQNATQQGVVALVSWVHSDGVMRLKRRRDVTPDLLLHVSALDQITCVCTSCTCSACPVFAGHTSGRVVALRVRGPGSRARPRVLHAHRAPLAHMHVCARAHLLVTASVDGLIVLWDLNKLTYIRTLPNRDMLSVTHVTISETLCDVASVHVTSARREATSSNVTSRGVDVDTYENDAPDKYKSLIRVHTVNASFVGSVKVSERVTCVCYSNAPEGVSVNCIAAGLQNGGVRLFSSWDLCPVSYIPPVNTGSALLSLTYSSDSQLLFGCYADGLVVAWEGGATAQGGAGAGGRPAPVRIHPAHALL